MCVSTGEFYISANYMKQNLCAHISTEQVGCESQLKKQCGYQYLHKGHIYLQCKILHGIMEDQYQCDRIAVLCQCYASTQSLADYVFMHQFYSMQIMHFSNQVHQIIFEELFTYILQGNVYATHSLGNKCKMLKN